MLRKCSLLPKATIRLSAIILMLLIWARTSDVMAYNEPSVGVIVDYNLGLGFMDVLGDAIVCGITIGFSCDEEDPPEPIGIGIQGSLPMSEGWSVKIFGTFYKGYNTAWVGFSFCYNIVNRETFNLFFGIGPAGGIFFPEDRNAEGAEREYIFYPDLRAGIEWSFTENFAISVDLYAVGLRAGVHYWF